MCVTGWLCCTAQIGTLQINYTLKNSKNKENAHKLIDFLIRKDILSKNMNYTYYAVPNQEVINENELVKSVTKIDDEYFKKMEVFKDPSDFLKEYDNIWTDVKAD